MLNSSSPIPSTTSLPFSMVILGYTGLIPFIVLAGLPLLSAIDASALQSTLNAYAFGIISFMCGTWWRTQRQFHYKQYSSTQNSLASALLLSNLLFLIALFAFVLTPRTWPMIASALFLLIFTIEHHTPLIGRFTVSYKRMRRVLSVVASITMMCSFIFNGA